MYRIQLVVPPANRLVGKAIHSSAIGVPSIEPTEKGGPHNLIGSIAVDVSGRDSADKGVTRSWIDLTLGIGRTLMRPLRADVHGDRPSIDRGPIAVHGHDLARGCTHHHLKHAVTVHVHKDRAGLAGRPHVDGETGHHIVVWRDVEDFSHLAFEAVRIDHSNPNGHRWLVHSVKTLDDGLVLLRLRDGRGQRPCRLKSGEDSIHRPVRLLARELDPLLRLMPKARLNDVAVGRCPRADSPGDVYRRRLRGVNNGVPSWGVDTHRRRNLTGNQCIHRGTHIDPAIAIEGVPAWPTGVRLRHLDVFLGTEDIIDGLNHELVDLARAQVHTKVASRRLDQADDPCRDRTRARCTGPRGRDQNHPRAVIIAVPGVHVALNRLVSIGRVVPNRVHVERIVEHRRKIVVVGVFVSSGSDEEHSLVVGVGRSGGRTGWIGERTNG